MTLLTELRSGTREAHDRLETGLEVVERCRDAGSYALLLQGFRSLYAPLERAVAEHASAYDVVPDLAVRGKTSWLDADLAHLGAPVLPDAPVPPLVSAEDVAGACYVMEGATLGGALLVRQLAGMPVPVRFFTSYGEQRGAMWKAFREHLAAFERRGGDADRVVRSARATFRCFEQVCA